MDKLEKQKLKLQEKRRRERNKQIQKSAKRLGDRLERMTVFFGVFLCLLVTVMDVLEAGREMRRRMAEHLRADGKCLRIKQKWSGS